jgi:hypothetical protein
MTFIIPRNQPNKKADNKLPAFCAFALYTYAY